MSGVHTSARLLVCATLLALGCGSSSEGAKASADTGATDDADGPKVPATSCVRPGDKGNDKGVGTPCTPFGRECDAFASSAPVCLADVGQDQWMCTRVGCKDDGDCGKDATCYKDPGGSACVPNRCLDAPPDSGTDARTDGAVLDGAGASDGGGEAGSDAALGG